MAKEAESSSEKADGLDSWLPFRMQKAGKNIITTLMVFF